MTRPVLYGLGVGPGDPELMSLRAVRILREVPVLVAPRGSAFGESAAFRIARPHLSDEIGQKRMFFTFPMSKDPDVVGPAVDAAVDAVCAELGRGQSVAFIAEGDASTFSSFIYVQRGVRARMPEQPIEVVPAVSSIMAVPAAAGIPLCDGQERVAIVPGTYGLSDLDALLDRFDTLVVMKVGPELPHITEVLRRRGLLEHAVYVSHATEPRERVVRDIASLGDERGGCFAMLVVRRNERAGLLTGHAPHAPLAPSQP